MTRSTAGKVSRVDRTDRLGRRGRSPFWPVKLTSPDVVDSLVEETQILPVLTAIVVFIAGALVGGSVNALVERYAVFKESKGIALAIQAEMDGLVTLATYRKYVTLIDAMIVRLQNPSHVLSEQDVFFIQITQDYFSVFHALSPKIGLLGALARDVVLAYSATKSLFEDIARLREEAKPVLDAIAQLRVGMEPPLRPEYHRTFLLEMTTSISTTLKESLGLAVKTSVKLGAFANRRWLLFLSWDLLVLPLILCVHDLDLSGYSFECGAVLPKQFFADRRKLGEPIERLMFAVLNDAIRC
jgi:hypothetical protein